mgnify:CR=1 FL=1
MTVFYLIRHGETDWNATGRWQGHADVPLNENGREQARRLGARLRREGVRFDAIYSSDLQRAWATATIIGAALSTQPQPLVALREIDVGRWSGLTGAEVAALDGEILARLESGEDVPRGGAERFADLYSRAVSAVNRVLAMHPNGTVALVTHGGVVRALLLHAARDKSDVSVRRAHVGNTALSILIHGRGGWDFGAINDMSHLEGGPLVPDVTSDAPDDAERPL